jgi:hypothetical protein
MSQQQAKDRQFMPAWQFHQDKLNQLPLRAEHWPTATERHL